jgi:SAM-dependent methyltransferase
MNDDNWSHLHKLYAQKDWSNAPSIFATEVIEFLPKNATLLELGAGVGQDSIYFAENHFTVTATDLFIDTLTDSIKKSTDRNITIKPVDLRKKLEFADSSYEVVYAHLSLHYFDHQTTEQLFKEIHRILKPGGILAFFTNSTSDPEYGTGEEIEPDYFMIDGVMKRYFSVESLKPYLKDFDITLLDANGETYKDRAVGVHHLIRAVAVKR